MNTYIRILASYFQRRLFLGAVLFALLPTALIYVVINMVVPGGEKLHGFLLSMTLPMLAISVAATLGIHLKALVATPLSAMLPEGRSRPLITLYWLLFAFVILAIPELHQRTDLLGLFAISLASLGVAVLAGFWQGPYIGLIGILPILFERLGSALHIPFFDVARGGHPYAALFYLLLGFALFAFVAYRALTLGEERSEYRWNQFSNPGKAAQIMYGSSNPSLGIRLASRFYQEKDYRGLRYDIARFPDKFTHWRAALGPAYNPVYFSLIVMTAFVGMSLLISTGRTGGISTHNFIFLLYFFSMVTSAGLVALRLPYLPTEGALPLSRRQYVLTMGGMLLLASYGSWLSVTAAMLFSMALVHVSGIAQPQLWLHVALSACFTFTAFAGACLATHYAGRQAAARIMLLALLPLMAIPTMLDVTQIGPEAFAVTALVCLALGAFLLRMSYRKWIGADFP